MLFHIFDILLYVLLTYHFVVDKDIIPVDVEDIVFVLAVEEMLFFGESVIPVNVAAVDFKVIKSYIHL